MDLFLQIPIFKTFTMNFFTLHKSNILGSTLGICSLFLGLSSCADDSITSPNVDSRYIRFDVESAETKNASTRSGQSSSLKVTELSGAPDELFLVPRIENTGNRSNSKTRSEIISSDNIDSFGVYAGYSSENGSASYVPNYMSNVEVTRTLNWAPQENYLWPGSGTLHFNVYSPYFDNNSSTSPTEGITAITNESGEMCLAYTTPAEVVNQKDLLYATPVDAGSSPCNLAFSHALTGIRFAAGAELVPITIKSISISGIQSKGMLNLETGNWSDFSNDTTFTVAPNITLVAEENSKYVASNTPITSDEETFLLLPQSLNENSVITIIADVNGKEVTMSSSLVDQTWAPGKTITYRISGNPAADSLTLDVDGTFLTQYTGSNISFNVTSNLSTTDGTTPVSWKAEFVDDEGNVIPTPNWVTFLTASGSGGEETGEIHTVMQDMYFEKISAESQILQNAVDINKSSGHTPYNLASSTGAATVENTANTYIINAPGTYSIPLVYGNGIKNGSANKDAYSINTHTRNYLKTFLNHLGNAITDPYIYNNASCTPSGAQLTWEDELNLVRNVRLSTDKKYLCFDIPHNTIRQGNAIVSVQDASGQTMWSWQLWITNIDPNTAYSAIRVQGSAASIEESTESVNISDYNLGYVNGGDVTNFPAHDINIRFTQTNVPDDLEPLTKTVTLHQTGIELETPSCNTFYQWGRKDPMMSSIKQWYNADHSEIKVLPTDKADAFTGNTLIIDYIQNPEVFYTGTHSASTSATTHYPYINLWNIGQNAANIKTIYDPSPVGYKVPFNDLFKSIEDNPSYYSMEVGPVSGDSSTDGFAVTSLSGSKVYFHAFSYRSGATASLASGDYASYWMGHASLTDGSTAMFKITDGIPGCKVITDPLFHGLSVRPVKE